jgi:hypothetical protein
MIRVILPAYLQRLANIGKEIQIELEKDASISMLLDRIEDQYPMFKGTIRDHNSGERREYLRFFACGLDISHSSMDATLPGEVLEGKEPFRIIGAMSGG